MKIVTIKDLEQLSGIKAHTIRIWEKRYAIVKPARSETNFRHYNIDELNKILNIAVLLKCKFKISKLSKLEAAGIQLLVNELKDDNYLELKEINKLIIYMFLNDIESFDSTLNFCIQSLGSYKTIEGIIIPFIEKIKLLSYIDTNIETHLVVCSTRRKIILGIELTEKKALANPQEVLIFLPEGEQFDLIAVYLNFLFKNAGYIVLYLGTNISIKNLEEISLTKQPKYLVTYIAEKSKYKIESYFDLLAKYFPSARLIITVGEESLIKPAPRKFIQYIYYFEAIDNLEYTEYE